MMMFMESWRAHDGPLCLDDFDDGDGACLMWWSPDDGDRAIHLMEEPLVQLR